MIGKPFGATIDVEVPFHDVDALGVVWHGHYYKYLELARTALFRQIGVDVAAADALGLRLLVAESRCRHSFPAKYGDRLRVCAWISEIDPHLKVSYEVFNVTRDRRSARGATTIVATHADRDEMVPISLEMLRAQRATSPLSASESHGGNEPNVPPEASAW